MKILIKELFQSDSLTGNIEICGKVIYTDIGNKNIIIKGSKINVARLSQFLLLY